MILLAINQFSGCFTLINYSATIFANSGSTWDPNVSSIILATIQIIATYISTILVDRVGRKILLAISAAATSCGLTVMGLYSYLEKHDYNLDGYSWVPVTSLSFVIFIASIGILPLPFIVLAEVLPDNVIMPIILFTTTTNVLYCSSLIFFSDKNNRFNNMHGLAKHYIIY